MICYVMGCTGFAKRCDRVPAPTGGTRLVLHVCADHWPKVVS